MPNRRCPGNFLAVPGQGAPQSSNLFEMPIYSGYISSTLILFMRLTLLTLTLLSSLATHAQTLKLSGFSNEQADAQLQIEKKFDDQLQPANLKVWMKRLAARPHHLGSHMEKKMPNLSPTNSAAADTTQKSKPTRTSFPRQRCANWK